MLQKLSKCEVKAWLWWNLIILLPLRFYVKSYFGKFRRSKYFIFGNFRDSKHWICVNLGLESCSNLPKSRFRTTNNDNLGPFELAKIWFHVKSEWRSNYQISTKSNLNFTFWKFLEHSALGLAIKDTSLKVIRITNPFQTPCLNA